MADPMTILSPTPVEGKPVTISIAVTSTGAINETATIPAGMPYIDLSKAHPIISMAHLVTETDQTADSVAFLPAGECARAATPDSAGEWAILTKSTINFYSGVDKDGILFVTYYGRGVKLT